MVMKKDVKFVRVVFLAVVGATILKLVYDGFFAWALILKNDVKIWAKFDKKAKIRAKSEVILKNF